MNVLFVTLDQFRGDSFGAAGHPLVQTPVLDRIAQEGIRLERHYSQAAPCAPGRAALYTGMYQMNNRVVANGTPLAHGFSNLATVARSAGYDPTLFGYTDQGLDPNWAQGVNDPRLNYYDGILPGFSVGLYLSESQAGWMRYLRAKGYDLTDGCAGALRTEPDRPADDSVSGYLSSRFIQWLDQQESGWFAHLSYLRPHPPYAAAGHFASMYDPADIALPIAPVPSSEQHWLHQLALGVRESAAPVDLDELRRLRAQYFGMISEVDSQVGRVVDAITARGEWDDTLVVVTSDHGEQLGDHGLLEKLGFFPQSYHVLGLWRDPRRNDAGSSTNAFTENVDLLATLASALGVDEPVQSDGRSMESLWADQGDAWRTSVHYEWDYRTYSIRGSTLDRRVDRSLNRQSLAVSFGDDVAYVQFGDGSYLCFDVAADPSWRTPCHDLERVLAGAQELLVWRQEHLRRDLTDMLLGPDRRGRWPQGAQLSR